MAILGTIALITLVILSVMVLRVKSDPMEKQSIRDTLAKAKGEKKGTSSSPDSHSPH
jgi:hypothetical protein